jgi:hypothetical protein
MLNIIVSFKTEIYEKKRWLIVLVSVNPEPDGNDTEKADENPILPFLIFCRVITEPDREVRYKHQCDECNNSNTVHCVFLFVGSIEKGYVLIFSGSLTVAPEQSSTCSQFSRSNRVSDRSMIARGLSYRCWQF